MVCMILLTISISLYHFNYLNSILAVGGTTKKVIPSGNPDSPYKTANMVKARLKLILLN
jgi:hypothetical protein